MKKFLLSFVAAMICALGANAEVWKKVTSAPADWSGKYLIACDNGEDWAVLDGSRSGDPNSGNLQSSMNYKPYDVNADGNIELDACDYYVTIAKSGDAYTICTASGWYIGNNADSNTLGTTANAELAFLSTISLDAEQGVLITAVEGGSVLRYNHANGQDRFRFYKASTYTNQQKIALYKLEEAQAPVEPEVKGYVAVAHASDLKAGQEILIINRYGWGAGTWRSSDYMWYHNGDMDVAEQAQAPIFVYDGEVNASGCPTSFRLEDAGEGQFYLKDLATGKYLNGATSFSQSDTPSTPWTFECTDSDKRFFSVYYTYNDSKRYISYGGWVNGGPSIASSYQEEYPQRIYVLGASDNGGEVTPVEPTTTFTGVVTPSLTSVSSLAELEGIQLTFVDADQVSLLEEGDGIYVQNKQGDDLYAIWHPLLGGTCEINGNVVTLRNFYTDNSDGYFVDLTPDVKNLYFEDYGTFDVSNAAADWDGYFATFTVAYESAEVVAQPFDLAFVNSGVTCENGKTVEANEAGVGTDFYLVNQGLTAKGTSATLYKDGTPLQFVMTMLDARAVSFLGGSSLITEPGTYVLEVPAGAYVDAAGNPSNAFYGTWVLIEKDEPVVPVQKDKYTIKLSGHDLYFTTTEVPDHAVTTYSLSATPEYFYIEPSGNGYTIKSADTDKWVGHSVVNSWDFSNDEKVWTINSLEGEPTLILKDGVKGFGVDNQVDRAGVYTDKVGQLWIIEKLVEVEPESTVWNGNVLYSEAVALDDLLDFTVEFEDASSVEASGYDILGVVYAEGGNPYAIVMGNGTFDVFGSVACEGRSKVNVKFQKIADLGADAQSAAKAAIRKIGGFQSAPGQASVVFCSKSFVVDGVLLDELLCVNYELNGGAAPTGIETIATENGAQIFDLQGRRVRAAQNGLFIVNGVKVVR